MSVEQVRLSNVSKVFTVGRPPAPLHALGPVDLELRRGEFFAVVGPSGCGKSTLLELIAGLTPATEGTIAFEGRPIVGEAPDGIGVVFQDDASLPWLNVADNVAFGLRRARSRPRGARRAGAQRAEARSASPTSRRATRRSSPAGCASASASRARW